MLSYILLVIPWTMLFMDVPNAGTVPSEEPVPSAKSPAPRESILVPSPVMDREAVQRLAEEAQRISDRLNQRQLSRETIHDQRQLFASMESLLTTSQTDSNATSAKPTAGQADPPISENNTPTTASEVNNNRTQTPSTQRNGSPESHHIPATRGELIDSIWGHLPERERDELARTYQEHSIPGYESRVRNYFTRLAEKVAQPPSETVDDSNSDDKPSVEAP